MNKGQANALLSPLLERSRLKSIARYIKGESVLDCGCGRAALKDYIPRNVAYVGIDKDRSINIPEGVKIYYFDLERVFPIEEKFDNIVLSEIIEHLENPKKTLLNLESLLKEDGQIIVSISIPIRYKLHALASIFRLTSKEARDEHKQLLSKKDLFELAKDIGLRIHRYKKTELWTKQVIILRK